MNTSARAEWKKAWREYRMNESILALMAWYGPYESVVRAYYDRDAERYKYTFEMRVNAHKYMKRRAEEHEKKVRNGHWCWWPVVIPQT